MTTIPITLTYDIKNCIENRNSIQHYDIQKLNRPFNTLIKVNKKSMGLAQTHFFTYSSSHDDMA